MRKLPLLLVLLLSVFSVSAPAQGQEVGFEEDFALASNRKAVLEQLIPGTPDYYFYHCLEHQHAGELEQVAPLLDLWIKRHGRDTRTTRIENLQALLSYASAPQKTFEFLIWRMGLRFDHRRQVPGESSPLPDSLDPQRISTETLSARALRLHRRSLKGFNDSMLERLAPTKLDERMLRDLMKRLSRPDIPNLPALLVRDLENKPRIAFGSLGIHVSLLVEQLEACIALRPELLNEKAFISTYLARLLPSEDVYWQEDTQEREAYLARLWVFAQRLAPVHNNLKAHVLQHQLLHDLSTGNLSRAKLLAFLRLPSSTVYVNKEWLKQSPRNTVVDSAHAALTPLGPTPGAEPLVRAYLEHFFQDDSTWDAFSPYVDKDYLRRVFVETKILAGKGDRERWYSLLDDSTYYEQLEARVEIEFPATQTTRFGLGQEVSLEVDIKNVDTLLVKVFEIDALAYAMAEQRGVDASIDLDGLVAASEATYNYSDNALLRIRRQFDFPGLEQPGVYVVDFIGGGLSSRAVIHKGRLQLRERLGSAGHVFTVLNEAGQVQMEAALYFGGRRYGANMRGQIVLPYSTDPGTRPIVLQSGRLVTVEQFAHRSESYQLSAGFYVDRESLLAGETARLLVRTQLDVNGARADLALIEQPVLTITASMLDGSKTSIDVRDVQLEHDREWVHDFNVPRGVLSLQFSLAGEVENLSRGEPDRLLSTSRVFELNRIDSTAQVDVPLLVRDSAGYHIDVLGKNGEPTAGRVVGLELVFKHFRDNLAIQLKTNQRGRVHLGELSGVLSIKASGLPGGFGFWSLNRVRRTYRGELHGVVGQSLQVPFTSTSRALTRADVSLIELRDREFLADRFSHVSLGEGFLELRQLPAGNYNLFLKATNEKIDVRITDGVQRAGWAVGRDRALELQRPVLQVTNAQLNQAGLELQLVNVPASARVHVIVSRFQPAYDAFGALWTPSVSLRRASIPRNPSTYDSGRQIGDEYRYILERRFAAKYPGNMLPRPGLLLNPWALQESNTNIGLGGGAGGRFGGRAGGDRKQKQGGGAGPSAASGAKPGTFPNLDFLPAASIMLSNLRPDQNGRLSIPADRLGDGQFVRCVIVDGETVIERSLQREEVPLAPRDMRLTGGLDAAGHFSEQRRTEFLGAGEEVTLRVTSSASGTTFDTLQDVFQLFRTLSPNSELEKFAFLTHWPDLGAEEKLEHYSDFACHELHVFLRLKDPVFFGEVVRPYLANKADKTFMDLWLLDGDLRPYVEPWAFSRLNTVEQVLLAERFEELREGVARNLRDHTALKPVDQYGSDDFFLGTALTRTLSADKRMRNKLAALGYAGEKDAGRPSGGLDIDGLALRLEEMEVAEEPALMDAEVDFQERSKALLLFQPLATTQQYVEHNYWHTPIELQVAGLVGVNDFWLDLAENGLTKPFRSSSFSKATGSVTEMLLALAVLDLPFTAEDAEYTTSGKELTVKAGSPMLLVRKELAKATPADATSTLLVGQQFYRLDDRFRQVDGQRREILVRDEFIKGVPYGCRAVVTNPSSEAVELHLLLQIPGSSIAINSGFEARSFPMRLDAYATRTVEFSFYFPSAGQFAHFPAHATRDASYLAFADPLAMNVVDEPSELDTGSWEHISQSATQAELVTYLLGANLLTLDLGRIAWRCADPDNFEAITKLLRERHVYAPVLWSYGLKHHEPATSREYLENSGGFVSSSGPWLNSPLLKINPIERHTYQEIEFRPLVNARAHPRNQRHEILNEGSAAQYKRFMNVLGHKPLLDSKDWMSVTHQLLLQGRTEEALESFTKVDVSQLPMRIQYDYMAAYMDFFTAEHTLARGIAEGYLEHPVPRWRKRFEEVIAQLDEAEGKEAQDGGIDGVEARNDNLAAAEPSLEMEVEAGEVTLHLGNLESCELRYYVMDVEFLFSTSPFVQQSSGSFSYVKPNRIDQLTFEEGSSGLTFSLPEEFRASNVLVVARSAGLTVRKAYYANSLRVQVFESYGQLKVSSAETGKPLPRVYVKVFSTGPNGETFHKDGYTDLRGRFDYVSVSGVTNSGIERFAILVLAEEEGAVIREATPPRQ